MTEEQLRDGLTGLFKWPYARTILQEIVRTAQNNNAVLSLILADIDDIMRFNDRNGHIAGDEVIKNLAKVIQSLAGESNIVSRIGGDEFVVMLPSVTLDDARNIAEAMREKASQTVTEFQNKTFEPLTMTFGLVEFPKHAADAESLLHAADTAMYEGKKAGRHMVFVAH